MRETGVVSKWSSSQLMTNRNYEINYYSDKDFSSVSLHSHDFFELYFFIAGDASYIIENGHYRLSTGDILLISPDNLHQLDIDDSRATYERIVLWLNPRYVKRLSTAATDLAECFAACARRKDFLLRDKEVSARVEALLFDLYDRQSRVEYGDDVECEIIIREVLLTLARRLRGDSPRENDDRGRVGADRTVSEVIDYIEAHITEDLSLDSVAERVFLNKFYLARLFKKETNTTLHRFILKKRLLLSKKFIENELPIVEVCRRSGFNDYSHFFRAFKNEYGITPKQYHALVTER